jgi:hypothetical protein
LKEHFLLLLYCVFTMFLHATDILKKEEDFQREL